MAEILFVGTASRICPPFGNWGEVFLVVGPLTVEDGVREEGILSGCKEEVACTSVLELVDDTGDFVLRI